MSIPELVPLSFQTDAGFGARARIGLIVLSSDGTLEVEARLIDLDGVDFYHSRIPNSLDVTPATLKAMEARLPEAAQLLPPDFGFDAIGYGCTSASTLIGTERVTAAIRTVHRGVECSNPIAAAVAAFTALNARRIAVVTPYTADVTRPVAEHFTGAGLEVTALASFLEPSDPVVARITADSIAAAVRQAVSVAPCDLVFVSCTSLRVLGLAGELEREIGLPVVSSNMALLWHLLRLSGVEDPVEGLGTLFLRSCLP